MWAEETKSDIDFINGFIESYGDPLGMTGSWESIVNHYQGAPYTYYFGSAWSLYDVCSEAQWQTVIDEFMNNLRRPLTYNITK